MDLQLSHVKGMILGIPPWGHVYLVSKTYTLPEFEDTTVDVLECPSTCPIRTEQDIGLDNLVTMAVVVQ